MANKYRLKGKFISEKTYLEKVFKPLIKTQSLDAVIYENLTTNEKRVYNGVKTAANRITSTKGRFLSDNLLKSEIIKGIAAKQGLTPKQYFDKNKASLQDANSIFRKGLPISKNSFFVEDFIKKHKGKFIYKGKEISRKELMYKISRKEQSHKTKSSKENQDEKNQKDTDFILIYEMRVNIFTNELEIESVRSLRDINKNRELLE